jgi:putative endonuclease
MTRQLAEQRGRRSETLAALLLMAKGYRIVARRVKTRAGEIDLIVQSLFGPLCFIEVKARSHERLAAESVGAQQKSRIMRAAELYVGARPHLAQRPRRYDIVTVAPFPRHYPDAWRAD